MRPGLAAVLIALVAALGASAQGHVVANGAGVEIYRGQTSGYELAVRVQPGLPVVGAVHITVTPLDASTSVAVERARITIVALDPEGVPTYQARAVSSPSSPQYYDANITFESPGAWTLSVDVSSDALGDVTFTVPLQIGDAADASAGGLVVWIAVVAAFSGGVTYLWYSSRRLRRSG